MTAKAVGPYCTNCGRLMGEVDGCACEYHNGGNNCTWCGYNPCKCPSPFEAHKRSHMQSTIAAYNEDYYMRGKEKGLSLYENYRWLPELTVQMCQAIADHLKFKEDDTILDFGCARGYVVKALRILGYDAYGQDSSEWAIDNCDPDVKEYVKCYKELRFPFDWIIAKDVLEHVVELEDTITKMLKYARTGILAVVPLSPEDGAPYVLADYEKDVTHVHRLTLASWGRMFLQRGWDVKLSYRVPGIKDNHYCSAWEPGDGFIVATRC